MRRNKNFIAVIAVPLLCLFTIWIILRHITFTNPVRSEPAFNQVFEDNNVAISISYMDDNKVSQDGTTFVSVRNQFSNDILLIVENLRAEGLIFTPTPTVTVIDSQGEKASSLIPFISVAGAAGPKESTHITLSNPVPPPNTKLGLYTYIINLQYKYIFYDRITYTDDVTITIKTEVRAQKVTMEFLNTTKTALPYLGYFLFVGLLFITRKKRR